MNKKWFNLKFTQQGDYMAGDFCGDALAISTVCKLINGLSKNNPVEFMVPRCEDLVHHTTDKSTETLMMEAYASIANNSSFVIIDAIDPVGTLSRKVYEKSRDIFREVRRHEAYLSADASIVADVAIYWSFYHAKTNQLFGYMEVEDEEKLKKMAELEVCKRWWLAMKKFLVSDRADAPKAKEEEMREVFYMAAP